MIIHWKITISWFTAYRYLFAFLHDINNNTSIDSYLLTLPIVCRDRSLYLAVSALCCTLVIDGHVM